MEGLINLIVTPRNLFDSALKASNTVVMVYALSLQKNSDIIETFGY